MNYSKYLSFNLSLEHQLLLQTAILSEKNCLKTWEKWLELVDIENLDSPSYYLLPLLYSNLVKYQVEPRLGGDGYMTRFKGVYRRNWYNNQLMLKQLELVLETLVNQGINPLILGDIALSSYYQDSQVKPIKTLDIFVDETNVFNAYNLLTKIGWQSKVTLSNNFINRYPKIGFWNENNQFLHLHWRIFGQSSVDSFPTISVKLDNISFKVNIFNTQEQLLYICSQIPLDYPHILPQWLADATIILNSEHSNLNWSQLTEKAQNQNLLIPLLNLFWQLKQVFSSSEYDNLLTNKLNISKFEKREYQLTKNQNIPLFGRFLSDYFNYLRVSKNPDNQPSLIGFAEYIQQRWNLDNLWQLPTQIAIRGTKKIGHILKLPS